MEIRTRLGVPEDLPAVERPDTHGTHTWWLLTKDTVGASALVLNRGELPPGTAHQLHRHQHAEQALLILAGRGLHLRDGEPPVPVSAGAAIFVPAGEWHGLANPHEETLVIASFYGGVGRREDAGYELHPGPPFDACQHTDQNADRNATQHASSQRKDR